VYFFVPLLLCFLFLIADLTQCKIVYHLTSETYHDCKVLKYKKKLINKIRMNLQFLGKNLPFSGAYIVTMTLCYYSYYSLSVMIPASWTLTVAEICSEYKL